MIVKSSPWNGTGWSVVPVLNGRSETTVDVVYEIHVGSLIPRDVASLLTDSNLLNLLLTITHFTPPNLRRRNLVSTVKPLVLSPQQSLVC